MLLLSAALAQTLAVQPFVGNAFEDFETQALGSEPPLTIFSGNGYMEALNPGPVSVALEISTGSRVLDFSDPSGRIQLCFEASAAARAGGFWHTVPSEPVYVDYYIGGAAQYREQLPMSGPTWQWSGWATEQPFDAMCVDGIRANFLLDDVSLEVPGCLQPFDVPDTGDSGDTAPIDTSIYIPIGTGDTGDVSSPAGFPLLLGRTKLGVSLLSL